jgi:DNA-binding NarL/FixJ family response regulator
MMASCVDETRGDLAIRVLVVEDFEPFRRFICYKLREKPELQIIGEASDGLEAVHKGEKLQPDLVLLDIGLPKLNGIEASLQLRKLAPASKIIFVTQESSADVVQEALSSGAWGYVVKNRAESDLLAAVEAVISEEHFVSSSSIAALEEEMESIHAADALYWQQGTSQTSEALVEYQRRQVRLREVRRELAALRLNT